MSPHIALADWRTTKGISQAELAKRLNVWPSTINRIESGKARPGIRLASRLAKMSDGIVTVSSWCEVEITEEIEELSDTHSEEKGAA